MSRPKNIRIGRVSISKTFSFLALFDLLIFIQSNFIAEVKESINYKQIPLCPTCLSQIHSLCQSDHPFPNISPIYCIVFRACLCRTRISRNLGFSYQKISVFHLLTTACVKLKVKISVGQKVKQYECQTVDIEIASLDGLGTQKLIECKQPIKAPVGSVYL